MKMHNSAKKLSPESSQKASCVQRFTINRWREIWLVLIIIAAAVIILTLLTRLSCSPSIIPLATVSSADDSLPLPGFATKESPATAFLKETNGEVAETEPQVLRRLPHFIIIGVKKAGSRALLKFLDIHPDVASSSAEVHFFDRDENYGKGIEWYREQMPESRPEQLTGEKSPGYYRDDSAPERIHSMNSSIKLILVVREPIDRSMSNYLQSMHSVENSPSFEEKVLLSNGEVNPNSPIVFNSDYNLFFGNWLKWFPRSQIKVVDGDLLASNPAAVIQQLEEFLGIRKYVTKDFFQFNEKKGFYCYLNHSSIFKCLGDSKGRKHPPIKPTTRAKLYKYFERRNQLFFKTIGKTFNWEKAEHNPTK